MDRWHGTMGRSAAGSAAALAEPVYAPEPHDGWSDGGHLRAVATPGAADHPLYAPADQPEDILDPAGTGFTRALAESVAILARKVDVLGAKAVDPVAIARLQRQTGELKELVERVLVLHERSASDAAAASASDEFTRLAMDALARLETRVDGFMAEQARRTAPSEELTVLRERLDAVAHDVKALGSAGDPRFAARLEDLLARFDRNETIEAAKLAPLVDVLERHLSRLVERVDETQVHVARLDGIEAMLQGLTRELQRLQEPADDEVAAPQDDIAYGADEALVPHETAVVAPHLTLVEEDWRSPVETQAPAGTDPAGLREQDLPVRAAEIWPQVQEAAPPAAPSAAPSLEEWPQWPTDLRREPAPRAEPRPEVARDPAWQVTEAPWQGELRELLETHAERRRSSAEVWREARADASPKAADSEWTAKQVAALEAALEDAQAVATGRCRTDWVAAADRAEHREKGAALARRRDSERRASLAIRVGAVALGALVLGIGTWFLLPRTAPDGASAGVAGPATAGGAPVDPALVTNLPPPVGSAALKNAALSGDASAAAEVGARYADGRGTDANQAAAMKWFAYAASHGSAPAAYRLGSIYENSKRDLPAARKLYQWAAERGNLRSMHNLGVMYSDGIDGKPDWQNAVNWFRKAADLGLRDSQFNLGVIYSRGLSGAVDRAEAWKWFSLAAAQGDTESARKREDVAAKAEPGVVDRARAAVTAFVPGKVVESANSTAVRPEWEVAGPADATPRKSASR